MVEQYYYLKTCQQGLKLITYLNIKAWLNLIHYVRLSETLGGTIIGGSFVDPFYIISLTLARLMVH